jgi:predicted ATPase
VAGRRIGAMPDAGLDSLVERDAEVAALTAAMDDAVRGQGRLAVVEGPAGIGKTRLLRAVRDTAAADGGARVLTARGTELEEHIAFGVVRQLLEPLVFALGTADREELFTGAARLARTVLGEDEPVAINPGYCLGTVTIVRSTQASLD